MDFTRDDVEVFDSLASPARLQILASLARQPLSYSDLMRAVGMTKQSAAGKFSYHLKRLLSAELVKVNEKSKLYELTSRGKTALQHVENLKDALKSSDMMLVRRTESTVENFDRNKIVNVLISEAGVPPKLASHVASIAEERLEGLKVEYLTGPLIRELVNALLIDMGLEKYRHKLTRLGMPLYDFGRLVDKSSENGDFCSLVKTASGSVIREYILLSVLPRDVGDAHLSGAIDLHAPELWLHGVDAKSYPLGAETLSAILDESLGVADEITLEVDEAGRKGLDNAATVLERLSSAKLMGGKRMSVSLPTTVTHEVFTRLKSVGANSIISPAPTQKHDLDLRSASICLAPGPVCSMGYTYSASRVIYGSAVLNLPRAYLTADGVENGFLHELQRALEATATALQKKLKLVSRFWKFTGPAHFIITPCGLEEVSQALAHGEVSFKSEVIGRLAEWCSRVSRDDMGIFLAGNCSELAAERLFRLDISKFGRKKVEWLVGSDGVSYSTGVLSEKKLRTRLELAAELSKHLTGGLRITFRGDAGWEGFLDTIQTTMAKNIEVHLIQQAPTVSS